MFKAATALTALLIVTRAHAAASQDLPKNEQTFVAIGVTAPIVAGACERLVA
jgi:hypothetical protein